MELSCGHKVLLKYSKTFNIWHLYFHLKITWSDRWRFHRNFRNRRKYNLAVDPRLKWGCWCSYKTGTKLHLHFLIESSNPVIPSIKSEHSVIYSCKTRFSLTIICFRTKQLRWCKFAFNAIITTCMVPICVCVHKYTRHVTTHPKLLKITNF